MSIRIFLDAAQLRHRQVRPMLGQQAIDPQPAAPVADYLF
jgi:hypothetical protein